MQYSDPIINNIVIDVFSDKKFIESISRRTTTQYLNDMISELYLILQGIDRNDLISLNNNNKLKGYIIKIVKNQMDPNCGNCFNKKQVIKHRFEDVFPDLNESEEEIKLRAIGESEEDNNIKLIKNMLLHVHPKKKEAFDMYYFGSKNYREISEITNVKLSTIALWVSSTLSEIKNKLENDNNNNNS